MTANQLKDLIEQVGGYVVVVLSPEEAFEHPVFDIRVSERGFAFAAPDADDQSGIHALVGEVRMGSNEMFVKTPGGVEGRLMTLLAGLDGDDDARREVMSQQAERLRGRTEEETQFIQSQLDSAAKAL